MPRVKLTKTVIDALPISSKDIVHWDTGCPGFGVKVTPKGAQGFRRIVSNSGSRVPPTQIYHWTVRQSDPQPSSRDGSEGVRRETRWTRSRCGEEGLTAQDGCRPG
jgi:hypothetical protein